MSIIAWDGKQIAADRQVVAGEIVQRGFKIKKLKNGEIVGWTGNHAAGLLLVQWYENGADLDDWPEFQSSEDWSHIIICRSSGLYYTDSLPCWFKTKEKFTAFGSGRDVALGAMAAGASAKKAVEITNALCTSCGLGVDSFPVPKRTKVAN